MKRKFCIVAMAAVIGVMASPPDTMADEHYVVTNGTPGVTPTPNYTTWATAATNIQDAVSVASDNDLVWVTNGTYFCWSISTVAGYTSMVTVTKMITIKSVNGPQATIVDANYPTFINRCFYISSGATLSGFTITNGHVRDVASGGGVFISGSGLVTNCWITGNVVTDGTLSAYCGGGGVYCSNGGEVVNCQIYGNIATNYYDYNLYLGTTNGGGGVCAYKGGIVRDCVISNNFSIPAGYAVRFMDANLISNCTIINNQGGGVKIENTSSGSTTVDTCRIIGNEITNLVGDTAGGGLLLYGPDGYKIARNCWINGNFTSEKGGGVSIIREGILSNCIISNNWNTRHNGGGVYMGSAWDSVSDSIIVEYCTIINNNCTGVGAGVYFVNPGILRNCLICANGNLNPVATGGIGLYNHEANTGLWVENCTVVNNAIRGIARLAGDGPVNVLNTISSRNWYDWYAELGTVYFTNCCMSDTTNNLPGSGNILAWSDITFVDYSANNFHQRLSSPCINAGINRDWMTNAVDLDGNARILNNIVDIGAYETFLLQGVIYKFH